MALGRSPEFHWNQIISKSVHQFSKRSCLKLFSIYSPGGHFVQRSVMYKTIYVINIIIYMCSQHSNVL